MKSINLLPKEMNWGNILEIANTLHENIILIAAYIEFLLRHCYEYLLYRQQMAHWVFFFTSQTRIRSFQCLPIGDIYLNDYDCNIS